GDIVYQGGNGAAATKDPIAAGGGGGSSAGTSSAGSSAISYLGASAVLGGGAGGDGKDSSNGNGLSGGSPGGAGGGARGTQPGTQLMGGTGGTGQIIVKLMNNKAYPVISQAPVATVIASGETLASSFLSGGISNVQGIFVWSSPSTIPGVTGNQSVTFTPTDSANYSSVSVLVNVVVTEPLRQGSWVNLADDGRLLYKRDNLGNRIPDFTACGYKAGKEGIPYVPTRVVVKPGDGDDRALIQAAIDRVAAMTPDANGFRGAVLLTTGEYQISGPLLISTSGVVLRGVGESETEGTRLKSTDRSGVYDSNQTILLQIQGSGSPSGGTAQAITSPYVPAGSSSFEVASVSGFSVGSEVEVYRPSTTGWITAIGMDQLSANDNGIDNRWKAGMRDLYWHRTIQRIEGNRIFL
ncbi:hypothetical protein EBY67_07280, partial [bacterium]|nr:hypothetical protein [bacterium]